MARYIKLVGCERFVDQESSKLFTKYMTDGDTEKVYMVDDNLADRLLELRTEPLDRAMFLEFDSSEIADEKEEPPEVKVRASPPEHVEQASPTGRRVGARRGSRNRQAPATEEV